MVLFGKDTACSGSSSTRSNKSNSLILPGGRGPKASR